MRKYLILLVILALLTVIALLLEFPHFGSGPSSKTLISVSPEAAASLTVSRGESGLTLKRGLQGWMVGRGTAEHPADTLLVSRILMLTENIEGDIVSVNPDNHSIFGVDRGTGTLVTLIDASDSTLASFIVGNPSKDFSATYVRRAHSDEVYAVTGFLSSLFRTEEDFYRNKAILSFSEPELETLRLLYPKKSLLFVRDTLGAMTLVRPEGVAFDSVSLKEAVSTLSRLNATGFADSVDEAMTGLRSPQLTVDLARSNHQSLSIMVGDLKDKSYYVAKEGDKVVYLVNAAVIERFYRPYEDYLAR